MTRWRTGRDLFSTARCFDFRHPDARDDGRAVPAGAACLRHRANLGRCGQYKNRSGEARMSVTRRQMLAGAAATLAAVPALGQEANWPQRPLRIIIPTSPGGSPDIASRLIGEKISGRLGQSVVVESMTTGGGVAGLQLVAKGAARRLHPGDADRRLCDPGRDAEEPALRSAQGFRLHHLGGALSDRLFGAAGFADQELQGHDRARQGQSQQGQLRHRRRRHALSSARQVDRQPGRASR